MNGEKISRNSGEIRQKAKKPTGETFRKVARQVQVSSERTARSRPSLGDYQEAKRGGGAIGSEARLRRGRGAEYLGRDQGAHQYDVIAFGGS